MRFRLNGNTLTPRFVRLLAATIALSAMLVSIPACADATTAPTRSAVSAKTHVVPNVVGWTASNAVTALHARGFDAALRPPKGSKVITPSHWTVTKQSPKGGKHMKASSKLSLSVVKTSTYLAQGIRSFYSTDYGTFPTITKTGTGALVFVLPKGITAAIVISSYTGGGRFTVSELGAGNVATKRVLVDSATSYAGTAAFGLVPVKVRTAAIQVSGPGSWHVTIKPIASAPIIAMPIKAKGDHVYLYSGPSVMWTVSSPGPTTFILNQISSSSYPNLAVNESGNWAGPVALQPGPSVVEIHSNGAWTIH